MRKIIKGKLYDTSTATHVATDTFLDENGGDEFEVVEDVYRTKGGAFFMVRMESGPDRDDDNNLIMHTSWSAQSLDQAERWFNTGINVDLHDESVFVAPDEATSEDEAEKTVSLTVRVPSSLREQLAKAASSESISMNAYIVRCARRCLRA